MHAILSSLSYHLWVATLILALAAGIANLVEDLLDTFHSSAIFAKRLAETLRAWLFRIVAIAAIASFGTAILRVLIGGDINAL
jgi:hypothetical protein